MRIFWRALPWLIIALEVAAWITDQQVKRESYNPAAHRLSGNPCPSPGHPTRPASPVGLGHTLNIVLNASDGAVWIGVALAIVLIIWCAWSGPGGWRGALMAAAALLMIVFAGFALVLGVSARGFVNTPTSCPAFFLPGK